MSKLTGAHYASAWIAEGGRAGAVAEAAAVGMCESGGDSEAVSSVGARGPWQFMPGTLPSDECAMSLRCSTREAIKLSNNGRDWSAWDCHPDAAGRTGNPEGHPNFQRKLASASLLQPWKWFLPDGGDGSGEDKKPILPGIDKIPSLGSGIAGALEDIAAVIVRAGELLLTPTGWARIGKVVGGALLIAFGLNLLAKRTTGSDPVGSASAAAREASTKGMVKAATQ